uniref:Phospho-N-acetylmuramoyl-pentapeptide-transferase n=2 Tax=Davidia involucrata TaxID=16924 RepID=A0A5B6YP85_DAVIN
MRSHSSSANFHCFSRLGVFRSPKRSSLSTPSATRISFLSTLRRRRLCSYSALKLGSSVQKHGLRHRLVQVRAMDEGISSLNDWGDNEGVVESILSSSEGEDSDGEIMLQPVTDVDLPTAREQFLITNDALTVTAHRFAMLGRERKKSRIKYGVLNNIGLMTFLTVLVLFVDWCAWRIVRLPLEPFYLTRPFCIAAILVSCAGYICVPILRSLKIRSIIRKEGPARHSSKKVTPTMGGLFFVPIGIIVAEAIVGFSSIEVFGAAAATLAFAAVGLLDDILSLIKNHNNGLSAWMRILLEVAVGTGFSFWLDTTNISSPYSMKMLVPLPSPLGLVFLGKCYLFLTSFCFVSMANGINLTDGLDGLAGGTAALAFIGMSIAVLPICSELAVFGASMAGACIGYLMHNRYKASVFMGDTGSLALGGALAAMAACTGMFFPLFISSGIFVLEAVSVIMQVSFYKTTKRLYGAGHRLFRMAPFHHHLELCGFKEPIIVAGAYVISCMLALFAGYVGLISV